LLYGDAIRPERKAARTARVAPLASSANAAMGPESEPDTSDSPVTAY